MKGNKEGLNTRNFDFNNLAKLILCENKQRRAYKHDNCVLFRYNDPFAFLAHRNVMTHKPSKC